MNLKKVSSFIRHYIFFVLIWLGLSSFFDLFFFLIGNFCFIFFYLFASKINFLSRSNEFFSIAFLLYLKKLIVSVFHSSKDCISIIFDEKKEDKSSIRKINVSSLNQEERVLFANIITMTPGTFVITAQKDDYYIHSLNIDFLNSLNTEKIREIILKTRKKK